VVTGESYYQRLAADDRGVQWFHPTQYTEGAWQPGEQHMAPVSGVIVHAIETFLADRPGDRLQLSRITFDILGLLAAADFSVEVAVLRPGRTIELVEATLTIAERPVIRARAWLLSRQDTRSVAGGQPEPLPSPDGLDAWAATGTWGGGYIRSLEMRPLPDREPGRTRAWIRTGVDLVAGEPASDLARYIGLVDTANGIAVRQPPTSWMFPNVDLSIHLYRQPVAGWVGLDTTVVFGTDGVGLTSTTLHDRRGPVGRAEQSLTVRPLPSV
jgi:hypothetical protein